MYCDSNGCSPKWWQWALSGAAIVAGVVMIATGVGGVFGGALLTAGVNSLVSGYINEAEGGSFTAGWIGGGVSGFLCGLTAGIGGNLLVAASNTSNFAMLGYLAGSIATSFGGGFVGGGLGSALTDILDGNKVNWNNAFNNALQYGSLNLIAGIGAGMSSTVFNSGTTAAYRVLGTSVSLLTESIVDLVSYGTYRFIKWWEKNQSQVRILPPRPMFI